jgi:hypothetical protein
MTHDLHQYIQTEIIPTAGVVEDGLQITELNLLITWINKNLRIEVPQITPQVLVDYLLMDNEGIIQKKRNFYLNNADFYDLELHLLGGNGSENEHKEIMSVLILPDAFVKANEFYYCTCDEWMILTSV